MVLRNDFTKNEIKELALEYKRRRNYLDLSQLKLAKHANLSQSIINKFENGKIDPTYSTILKIERALSELEKVSNLTAEKIMIAKDDIFYLRPEMKLSEVVEIIRKYDYSQFTVLDENRKLLGTVYEKSIFDAITEGVDVNSVMVERFINIKPIIVPPEYSASDLAFIFQNPRTKFVLVGKGGKIMGLVTKSDLFKR